jgi:hypothetical protein
MFAPAYAVWCIWLAHGAEEMAAWLAKQIPGLPKKTTTTLVISLLLVVVGLGIAFNGQSVSLRANRKAYDFAHPVLDEVKPSTLVVNGWVTASVLDYLRLVEGQRVDVQSFNLDFYNLGLQERHGSLTSEAAQLEWNGWLARQLQKRPLCFIEPLPAVPDHYRWTRQGLCWQLLPRSKSGR